MFTCLFNCRWLRYQISQRFFRGRHTYNKSVGWIRETRRKVWASCGQSHPRGSCVVHVTAHTDCRPRREEPSPETQLMDQLCNSITQFMFLCFGGFKSHRQLYGHISTSCYYYYWWRKTTFQSIPKWGLITANRIECACVFCYIL